MASCIDTGIYTDIFSIFCFCWSLVSLFCFGVDSARTDCSYNRVSKSTKFNGRWYEIAESQFNQSDAFVLVKLGISRYHFSAYLKSLKTIEQIFKEGERLKELDKSMIAILSKEIPESTFIPAYIAGFVEKAELTTPIDSLEVKLKRNRQKVPKELVIENGIGLFKDDAIRTYPAVVNLGIPADLPILLDGIRKEVDGKFEASSGLLKYDHDSWKKLVARL